MQASCGGSTGAAQLCGWQLGAGAVVVARFERIRAAPRSSEIAGQESYLH